jgi:hypothetical protein
MTPYKNLNGDSRVAGYHLSPGAIEVFFRDRYAYTYTEAIAGEDVITRMRVLALQGRGLNDFINRHARTAYVSKRAWA